jgi:uncharacterized repeat protein (TIGR03803 family)
MNARIGAVIAAFIATVLAGCSGTPQSNITPGNGSLSPLLRSEPKLGVHSHTSPLLKETVLYSFCQIASCADGEHPSAGLTNENGVLYGMTWYGGDPFGSTVYSITASGMETVVHSFGSIVYPPGDLIDVGGTLYGTTRNGGSAGHGTVFSVTPGGAYTLLHSFTPNDGVNPFAGLANVRGTLFGTTTSGGKDFGTIFSITQSGTYNRLYSFPKQEDACPWAQLTNVNGILYGTTHGCSVIKRGFGTVFKITTSGAETLLYRFAGGSDGAHPSARLTDIDGVLYGTTDYGGTGSCSAPHESGCGTVFSIDPSTGAEKVLYSFKGGTDGVSPNGLTNVRGTLYGTTYTGGTGCKGNGCGTVFKITTSGAEKVLYRFADGSSSGQYPVGRLITLGNVLYGATWSGGSYDFGTVFSLSGF